MRKPRYIITALTLLLTLSLFGLGQQSKSLVAGNANKVSEIKIDSIANTINSNQVELSNKIDSSFIVISILKEEIRQLKGEIDNQSRQLEMLDNKIGNPSFGVFNEFIYPVLLSIIAAIIFWVAFSYIPEKNRKNKIRSKIELEVYQVYRSLFALFDTVMEANLHSPSNYQQKIRGCSLKPRDIELGLQNKCLNEHFLYDIAVKDKLLPIGKILSGNISKIDQTIDRIFNFSMYLDSDEILLLENIRTKLHVYDLEDYRKEAVSTIGDLKLYPVNPSLSYLKSNLSDIYELFVELQDAVFSNKFENRDIFINKVQHYYYNEQYDMTIKELEKGGKHYPKDKGFLDFYFVLAKYKLNFKNEAYKKVEDIFESKPNLLSIRDFIKEILTDEKIKELLNKYFSESDFKEFHSVIQKEELFKNSFISNAKQLEGYYKLKSVKTRKKK